MGLFREKVKKHLAEKYKSDWFNAACRGKIDVIDDLIRKIDIDVKGKYGTTALMYASENEYKEMVELLLKAGADVNAKDNDGWTALMCASANGHKEIVELLLKTGADVNVKNRYGTTALKYASANGHKEIVELLLVAGEIQNR